MNNTTKKVAKTQKIQKRSTVKRSFWGVCLPGAKVKRSDPSGWVRWVMAGSGVPVPAVRPQVCGVNPVSPDWSGSWALLFSLVLRRSTGDPGGDLPQPPSSSGGLHLPISVPPVERSGWQRVFVEGAMQTGRASPARRLQNTLWLETVLLLVQEEKKSDQESKRG